MSTVKEIYNEIKSILSDDATLSDYVGRIYDREREFVPEKYRVVLMLEPTDVIEPYYDYPIEATCTLKIIGFVFESNPDRSVNDGTVKQVLDLENDVKNALRPYYTLNGKCLRFKFSSTKFDRKKDSWGQREMLRRPPIYGMEMSMNVQFYPPQNTSGFGTNGFGEQPLGF